MNKKIFGIVVILITGMVGCKNGDKKQEVPVISGYPDKKPKTLIDSLLKYIDDGHIVGMSKMGSLHKAKKEVQGVIDSIDKLPSGAQQKAAKFKASLNSVIKDIENADAGMEKWMPAYFENTDTLADNVSERIKYLNTEKIKVDKIKDEILTSLQKADSLLKAKF